MPEVEEKKTSFIDRLMQHSKKIIIGVVAFAVVVSGGLVGLALYNKNSVDPNVVAEVGGEKIYLTEYKERLFAAGGGYGSPTNPQPGTAANTIKESVLNELVDLKIIEKELAKRNITISSNELVQEAKNTFQDYEKRDSNSQKSFRDYVRLKVGKSKLLSEVVNWKEGFALYCMFNRADMTDMKDNPEAASKRVKDEAYAKDYCMKMKERLETSKSNFKEELAKLTADPEIGEPAWRPYSMAYGEELVKGSNSLGGEKSVGSPSSSTGVSSGQNSVKAGYNVASNLPELSSLSIEKNKYHFLTIQQDITNEKKESDRRNTMFAVVYIKDGNNGETANFDKWLKDKQSEYGVKTYVERIKI